MRTPFSLALVAAICSMSLAFLGARPAAAVPVSPAARPFDAPWLIAAKSSSGTAAWRLAAKSPSGMASLAQPVSEPDQFEPDDSLAQAKELVLDGDPQEHTFHQATDNDWIYFSLSAGDRAVLFTTGRTCDTYLTLIAPDGRTTLAEDDDSGGAPNAAIRFTADEDGAYYGRIRLFGSSPSPCGTYQVGLASLPPLGPDAYEPDDGPAQATAYELDGTPQERNIHADGDRDWVSFTVQAPIGVVLATGGECDTYLTLYDRDGTTALASDDDSGSLHNAALLYTITESGTYYAEVRLFNANETTCDEYLFGGITQDPALPDPFEPDNNAAQAKPLALDGSLQQRSFHTPDDDDWVSFSANTGDRVFLATEGSCDTYISVFAPDRRTLIREDDDAGGGLNAALLFTAQETGVHYARVRAFGGQMRVCASYQLYGALIPRPGGTPGATPRPGGTPGTSGPATPTATPRAGAAAPGATPSPTTTLPIVPTPASPGR
jgi:hypothetical protein